MSKVKCPYCSEIRAARCKRRGFLQTRIFSFFGYYPWDCRACGVRYYSHDRGEPQRHSKTNPVAYEDTPTEHIVGSHPETT